MPVSLVATRFHLVGEVQVENSHPQFKSPPPHLSCGDKIFILSGKCKLENLHPHGKTLSQWLWQLQKPKLGPDVRRPLQTSVSRHRPRTVAEELAAECEVVWAGRGQAG